MPPALWPTKLGRAGQRDVRQRVREVEEERPVLVGVDEADRFVGVAPGQRAVIDRPLDHLAVAHQRHVPVLRLRIVVRRRSAVPLSRGDGHPHVVRVRQPEPRVEALRIGRNGGRWPRCHLPTIAGRVAPRLQQLGDRDLVERQALRGVVAKHLRRAAAGDAVHAAADRQAAGEQRRPARRAHRLDVEAGPLLPLGGHRVEPRRADVRAAERAEVAVAQVVGEDDDDVRRGRGRLCACARVAESDEREEAKHADVDDSRHTWAGLKACATNVWCQDPLRTCGVRIELQRDAVHAYRSPVGRGPSGKTWPRCPPHCAQWTSTRVMP